MMKNRMAMACLALLMSGSTATAWGMDSMVAPATPNLLYVNLGFGIPLSDVDLADQGGGESKVGSVGFAGTGGYTRMLTNMIGVGAEIGGFVTGDKRNSDLLRGFDAKVNTSSLVFLATGRANIPLTSNPNLQPYGLLGLGFHHTSFTMQPEAALPPLYDTSGTGFALALGGGIDYLLTSSFFIGGQLRWEYLSPVSMDPNFSYRGLRSTDVGNSNLSFFATGGIKF